MTKFQKQMLTIAAAGALTAVTALPAMAFENEFHGLFNFNTVFSNYNNGTSGNFAPNGLKDKAQMNNYFEQRARLQYTAKASDDLKLVTQFEINNRWGKTVGAIDPNTGKPIDLGGNDLDADGLNIVTKHVYLDFNIGKSFNAKVGIQPYKDTIKGILIDADAPMMLTTTKMGAYTAKVGFSRYNDLGGLNITGGGTVERIGDRNTDLFVFDNIFAINKETKAALSYYFLADYAGATATTVGGVTTYAPNNQAKLIHTLGLSGETKVGPVALSGFAAMQAGHQKLSGTGVGLNKSSKQFHGWAANVAATMNAGPGKARTGFLFTSGNNSSSASHDKGWQSTGVQSYNESGLIILTRNTANSPTSTDQYVRRVITNVAVAYLGYDAKLTDKFNLDGGVGFAWVPASDNTGIKDSAGNVIAVPVDGKTTQRNSSDFMGTEIGLTAGYQLYKNLKLQAQAAYMINGGYYKNSAANNTDSPENPYTMRLQARYSF